LRVPGDDWQRSGKLDDKEAALELVRHPDSEPARRSREPGEEERASERSDGRTGAVCSRRDPGGDQAVHDIEGRVEPQRAFHCCVRPILACDRPGSGSDGVKKTASPPHLDCREFMQEMVIYGVSFDMVGKQPIVLLKTRDGNKFLPIWIGHPEAAAILMKLQEANIPRPMTHDLISEMLCELDVSCRRVAITELRENTFYAEVTLQLKGREIPIDSRPSDALALAVRTDAPIFAGDDVISESAIEFDHEVEDSEEVVEKFKAFLNNVTPEDFASGEYQ
jgi:uncharacterized protein